MRLRLSGIVPGLLGPLLLVALAGCGSDPMGPTTPEEVEYADFLGVDLDQMTMTESGLYYQTREEGEGEEVSENGDRAGAEYSVWLSTGQLLGTSSSSGPLDFTLGDGGLIAGVEEGAVGMRLNETRLLVIPYWLAYGTSDYGAVPAYSTLVFELTLTSLTKGGA